MGVKFPYRQNPRLSEEMLELASCCFKQAGQEKGKAIIRLLDHMLASWDPNALQHSSTNQVLWKKILEQKFKLFIHR